MYISITKQFGRLSHGTIIISLLFFQLLSFTGCIDHHIDIATSKADSATIIRSAVAEGKINYKLTEPKEVITLLGTPTQETTKDDGGMQLLILNYPGINAKFGKMRDYSDPFTLRRITVGGKNISIGEGDKIILRNENDLKKFDSWGGFCSLKGGVSLSKLDLRNQADVLSKIPFDSRTDWPSSDKMPKDFNPVYLLEKGKDPGLGIRRLHEQGIDGRGIGIAVIDQPILQNHIEYSNQIVQYTPIDVRGVPPQMHGPAVASIAVGKSCGVAPKAKLYYYAIPMWKWNDCQNYCSLLNKILKFNKTLKASEQIKIVSISNAGGL